MTDTPHRWSADREGKTPADDKLGRLEFAQRVARELGAWRNKESLVVSLNGDWGSGKTTLVNLIVHYIGEQSAQKKKAPPLVVRFNPWQWSGQDLITKAFFDEIGKKFKATCGQDKAKFERLSVLWEKFRDVTLATGEIAHRLRESIVALIAILAGGSGVLAGQAQPGGWATFFEGTSVLLLVVALLCGIYSPIAEALAKAFKPIGSAHSLDDARDALKTELSKLSAPLLIVIDDLDRLTKEQARMIVQLVKANADFDNVVYLLPFQRNIVAAALDHVTCEKGHDFLKKIVQVDLEVPDAPPEKLRAILFERLDKTWRRAEFRWDRQRKDRWRNVFEDAIWPFFDTPRSVIRFCSVVDFVFEGHIDDGVLRVDPIDLLLLETLRMFEPEAYELVKKSRSSNKNVLLEILYDDRERRQKIEADFNAFIDRSSRDPASRKRLREALFELVPQAGQADVSDRSKAEWDRDCRLCHPKHFPKYFQLQPSADDVSAGFVAKFLKGSTPEARLRELWVDAVKANKVGALIERLWLVRDDVPEAQVEPLVSAILATTDDLPEIKIRTWLFERDAEHEMAKLCARLLTRIEDGEKRDEVFKNVVLECPALTGPVMLTSFVETSPERAHREDVVIRPAAVEQAKSALLPRMWDFANTRRFWELRMAGYILYRLKDWGGIEPVRAWLESETQRPSVARKLLIHFLNESQSSGEVVRTQVLPAKSAEEFVDLATLAARAGGDGLTSLEHYALERVKLALQLKADGKPYDQIPVLGYDAEGNEITDLNKLRL